MTRFSKVGDVIPVSSENGNTATTLPGRYEGQEPLFLHLVGEGKYSHYYVYVFDNTYVEDACDIVVIKYDSFIHRYAFMDWYIQIIGKKELLLRLHNTIKTYKNLR